MTSDAIERHLASGVAVDAIDPERGGTPLLWAAVTGRAEAIELLIRARRGRERRRPGRRDGPARGGLPGPRESGRGAHPQRREGQRGEQARQHAPRYGGPRRGDDTLLRIRAPARARRERPWPPQGRDRRSPCATTGRPAGRKPGLADILMQMPLFSHLWFLWFLWWLVLGYAAVSAIGSRLPVDRACPHGWSSRRPATSG